MTQKNIGLIIHGLFDASFPDLNNHTFDCNDNIKKLLNNFSDLIDEVIIVTLESEKDKIDTSISANKKVKILYPEDPGKIELYSDNKTCNGVRSFYYCHKGIREFSPHIKHVIKTRTDYYIDLEKTIDFYFKEFERKKTFIKGDYKGIICSNKFILTNPYWICDLFYIGERLILEDFFYSQVKYKKRRFFQEKVSSPESDSVLKFLYYIRKNISIFKESSYFPNLPKKIVNKNQIFFTYEFRLWQYALKNFFSVLSDEIKSSSCWKGKDYEEYEGKKDLIKNENYKYEDFRHCEKDYIKSLRNIIEKDNKKIILNTKIGLINFNFIKRKCENFVKGKINLKYLWILIKISVFFRKMLFSMVNR